MKALLVSKLFCPMRILNLYWWFSIEHEWLRKNAMNIILFLCSSHCSTDGNKRWYSLQFCCQKEKRRRKKYELGISCKQITYPIALHKRKNKVSNSLQLALIWKEYSMLYTVVIALIWSQIKWHNSLVSYSDQIPPPPPQ